MRMYRATTVRIEQTQEDKHKIKTEKGQIEFWVLGVLRFLPLFNLAVKNKPIQSESHMP